MKKIKVSIILMLCLLMTGCMSGNSSVNNSTTNKTVNYEDVDITSLQDGLEMAIEIAGQSVVSIEKYESSFFDTSNKSIGSGVITKKVVEQFGYTYYVLTNRHVIFSADKDAGTTPKNIRITINGNVYEATYIVHDLNVDLAIIEFASPLSYPVAKIADSLKLKRGHIVLAIGTPYRMTLWGSVTMGIVSYNGRAMEDEIFGSNQKTENEYIQHDAAINPGNSGGGLFNLNGELIGINTLKIWDYKVGIENLGFAIPTQTIKTVFPEFLTY